MIKQILISIVIVSIELSVPGFENRLNAINSGSFAYDYFIRNIFVSYFIGLAIEYTIYISLKNKVIVNPWVRFIIQLTISSIVAFVMIHYTMGLMSV